MYEVVHAKGGEETVTDSDLTAKGGEKVEADAAKITKEDENELRTQVFRVFRTTWMRQRENGDPEWLNTWERQSMASLGFRLWDRAEAKSSGLSTKAKRRLTRSIRSAATHEKGSVRWVRRWLGWFPR